MANAVALVHDYLLVMRGAERTFREMAACWPGARIHTFLYDEAGTGRQFSEWPVESSWLQRLGLRQRGFRYLLPLFPVAARHVPTDHYDLVVSSTSAFAHGVPVREDAVHVSYCHSPFRYAWHERERALAECPRVARPVLSRTLDRIRAWDREAAKRVTHYLANSRLTQERIAAFYGRDSHVVHPPVAVERFTTSEPEDYLLFVGELTRHKRPEVAIEAATLARLPLRIVGAGPELERLEARYAGQDIAFLGRVDDEELERQYARCLALVVPNVEEFGIAAVEAQAAGRPVIAVEGGGVLETVVDGETGVLVDNEGGARSLAAALVENDLRRFDAERIRSNAMRFSSAAFRRRFAATVEALCGTGDER